MTSLRDSSPDLPTPPSSLRLLDLMMGSWRSGVVSAFAELGVADAFHGGTVSASQLASRLGIERKANDRFCRVAAAVGLVHASDDGNLSLTDLGAALATDAPDSMRNFARWSGSTADRATWTHLSSAVRTGRSPFAAVHGSDVWEFLDAHPETGAVFDAAMTELSRNVIQPVVSAIDFSDVASVTDVGGGRGALLSAALIDNPHLCGVLVDQPEVVASAPEVLKKAGVEDRVTIAPGSFFDSVPSGSDLFLISNVLHDWEDRHAHAILRNISAAMREGDQIAVVEAVVGVDGRFDEAIGLMDMDMLVLCNGKQRSIEEFGSLFLEVDIQITGVSRAGLQSIVHGTKTT